jgi:hypothetical protein
MGLAVIIEAILLFLKSLLTLINAPALNSGNKNLRLRINVKSDARLSTFCGKFTSKNRIPAAKDNIFEELLF